MPRSSEINKVYISNLDYLICNIIHSLSIDTYVLILIIIVVYILELPSRASMEFDRH